MRLAHKAMKAFHNKACELLHVDPDARGAQAAVRRAMGRGQLAMAPSRYSEALRGKRVSFSRVIYYIRHWNKGSSTQMQLITDGSTVRVVCVFSKPSPGSRLSPSRCP